MRLDIAFFMNSALLGVGLAMDAFSVSMANAMAESRMRVRRMCGIAAVYAVFQAVMPMTGWAVVHAAAEKFKVFAKMTPVISLLLLGFIGGKMIVEGIKNKDGEKPETIINFGTLLLQGVATSIDALSVGFTISEYNFTGALTASLIIATVTFIICMVGLAIGKKFGTLLANKASVFGGCILVVIGLEIFIKGIL